MDVARAASVEFKFWYPASWLAKLIQGQGAVKVKKQETQAEREAKVSRLQVLPENVVVDLSDEVRFVAIAYDRDGNAVGGVKTKWSGQGASPNQKVRISPQGKFEAMVPGEFTIMASAGGQTSQVKVTVRATPRHTLKEKPISTRTVSSRDLPPEAVALAKEVKGASSRDAQNKRSGSVKRSRFAYRSSHSRADVRGWGLGWQ